MARKRSSPRCSLLLLVAVASCIIPLGQQNRSYAQDSMATQNNPYTRMSPSLGTDQDSLSSVHCLVVDQAGHSVGDVAVQLKEHSVIMRSTSGYTDSFGRITFSRLPYGSYEITAAIGTSMAFEHVLVNGISQEVVVTIQRNAASAGQGPTQKTVSVRQMAVPRNARKELTKAESALSKHEIAAARKHVECALQLHPNYADALALRGILNLAEGDSDGSVTDLKRAISYDPSLHMPYSALASIYNDRHDYDAAAESAARAISLSPLSWQGHYEAARARLGKGDCKAALDEVQRAEKLLTPRTFGGVTVTKASALVGLGDEVTAKNLLREFLENSPRDPHTDTAKLLLDKLSAETNTINPE